MSVARGLVRSGREFGRDLLDFFFPILPSELKDDYTGVHDDTKQVQEVQLEEREDSSLLRPSGTGSDRAS